MFGFTKQEQGIALFLIFALIVGAVFELYRRYAGAAALPQANTELVEEFQRRAAEINQQNSAEEPIAASIGNAATPTAPKRVDASVGWSKPAAPENLERFLININTAGQQELERIPRVGPATAQKIIDLRLAKGGFTSIEQLVEVRGIGMATLEKMRPYITLN